LNIRDLKLFKHLTGTLHFGQTSQACNITPSGLTRTIQRLENELGKKLFTRNQRTVTLTGSGRIFASYADEVLQSWNKLQNDLNRDGILRGELTLYCSVTAILSILPSILERFRNTHPRVHINLQTGDAAMALGRLESGEADISIAALPDDLPASLTFKKIIETPLIFIAPKDAGKTVAYRNGSIDWQKTPLILAERGLSRSRTEAWFRKKRVVPNVYSQVAGNEAIITLVSMGCGVGIIPELVLLKSPMKEEVKILQISPALQTFSVGVCTTIKNMHNPIVSEFWHNAGNEPEHET